MIDRGFMTENQPQALRMVAGGLSGQANGLGTKLQRRRLR
jgi:hypothetical protein